MSENFPYADIVFLAVVAAFIALRLRDVLGKKTGNDSPLDTPVSKHREIQDDRVIQLPNSDQSDEDVIYDIREEYKHLDDPRLVEKIEAIRNIDSSFRISQFEQGAKAAFEMIIEAYRDGDKDTLNALLSKPIYKKFAEDIDRRTSKETKEETTLLSIESVTIETIDLQSGGRCRIGVGVTSEQVFLVRDAAGEIVEGDPSDVEIVEDHWVFERNLRSQDPNWTLIQV